MDVTLLYFEGCPNWKNADKRLSALAEEFGWQVERLKVETPEQAEEVGFRGSPTILVGGRDPFAKGDEPVGLSCRIYQTPEGPVGAPTEQQLRHVLL
ncbi:MAG: thioredoxin family protein [Actinomycetota bacterium]|nr:thioredoxin family protein [Actinomycetota bacterium]